MFGLGFNGKEKAVSGSSEAGFWAGLAGVAGATFGWFENFVSVFWSGLEWPHSALIIVCIGIYFFRHEVRGVIPRIKKIGTGGVEVDPQPPLAQPTLKDEKDPQYNQSVDYPSTFAVALNLVESEVAGKNQDEQLKYLIGVDAGWRVLWLFENTYSYILGGQIQLLQLLNERRITGLSNSEAEVEWAAYKERFKPHLDEWQPEPFISFLIARELIVQGDGVLNIAPRGSEFLVWMTKYGRSPSRPW